MLEFKRTRAFAIVGALLMLPFAASASVLINPTTYGAAGCLGNATCTIDGATLSLTSNLANQHFTQLTFATSGPGISGLGVGPAFEPGTRALELQHTETINIAFSIPQIVEEIRLAHFYNPQQISSDPQEVAVITATLVGGATQVLSIVNQANNIFGVTPFGAATVGLLNAAQGLVSITDLFAGAPILNLVFATVNTPKVSGKTTDNSDYSIHSIQTAAVPLPAAGFLLLAGLGGLGLAARRRQSA